MQVAGAIAAAFLAVAMSAAPRGSGQQQCSCTEKDPTTAVELQITAAMPEEYSRIGPEQETLVVDLRGQQTVLVGEAPELLASVDLAEVPVLLAVVEAPSSADECSEPRPAAGTDLSLTGHVYTEETGPVVWTGPCQGTLTIDAATSGDSTDADPWGRALAISVAVLAGLAILCLALVPVTARRQDHSAPPGA